MKILSDRILRIKGSAEHSRCKCVDRLLALSMYNYAQQCAAQKMPSKKDDCLRQPACFLYNQAWHFLVRIEDNANTTNHTSTTHYTNTFFKLTIVTHLSFSERIAIANLSYNYVLMYCTIAHNALWYCSMTPTIS